MYHKVYHATASGHRIVERTAVTFHVHVCLQPASFYFSSSCSKKGCIMRKEGNAEDNGQSTST